MFFVFKQNHTTPNTQCLFFFWNVGTIGRQIHWRHMKYLGKMWEWWKSDPRLGRAVEVGGVAAFGQVMIRRKFLDGISSLQMFLDQHGWKGWSLTVPFFFREDFKPAPLVAEHGGHFSYVFWCCWRGTYSKAWITYCIPAPASRGAKWFCYRVSMHHPLGFNWQPRLEGPGTWICFFGDLLRIGIPIRWKSPSRPTEFGRFLFPTFSIRIMD